MTLKEAFPEVGAPVAPATTIPAETPTVKQVLVTARRRVAAGWAQGHSVDVDENGVARYCLLAALAYSAAGVNDVDVVRVRRAVANEIKEYESRPLRRLGLRLAGGHTDPVRPSDDAAQIVRFNDRNRTTQRDVIRVLDRAIERSSE